MRTRPSESWATKLPVSTTAVTGRMSGSPRASNRPGGLGVRNNAAAVSGHLHTLEAHGLIVNTTTTGAARWEPTEKGRKAALPNGVITVDDL